MEHGPESQAYENSMSAKMFQSSRCHFFEVSRGHFSRTQGFLLSAGSEQTEPSEIIVYFTVLFDADNLTEVTTQ